MINDPLQESDACKLKSAIAILLVLSLAVAEARAQDRQAAGGAEPAPTVAADRVDYSSRSDDVVEEIEVELSKARRILPRDDFLRTHTRIVTLIDELRNVYPDDEHIAKFLPHRWLSLKYLAGSVRSDKLDYLDKITNLNNEIADVIKTTTNPELKREALFYHIGFQMQEPMDGPVAAQLAESFARRWPDDNRAAGLLYDATNKLDIAWSARMFLFALLVVVGASAAIVRRKRPPSRANAGCSRYCWG